MATSPTSRRTYSSHGREPSPASSFLDKFALGSVSDDRREQSRFADTYGNHGQEDRHAGHDGRLSGEAWVSHTHKRSATSPTEELQHQESIKRLRHDDNISHLQAKAKSCRYADAATQYEVQDTTSAKIAQLREEETASKVQHEAQMAMAEARYEAEVARRRQVMAELEYQSKMAAWRQLSESSSKKESTAGLTATGSTTTGTSDPVQYSAKKTIVDGPSSAKEPLHSVSTKTKPQEAAKPQASKIQQATRLETSTPIRQDTTVKSPLATKKAPESSLKVNGSVKQSSVPDTSKTNGLIKRTTAPETVKAAPTSPARGRTESSGSHSVQIKTSRSPPAKPPTRPQADESWAPGSQLKHLTCHFWKNTPGCNKSASECSYAHYDTGVTASAPEHLRRYKRW